MAGSVLVLVPALGVDSLSLCPCLWVATLQASSTVRGSVLWPQHLGQGGPVPQPVCRLLNESAGQKQPVVTSTGQGRQAWGGPRVVGLKGTSQSPSPAGQSLR